MKKTTPLKASQFLDLIKKKYNLDTDYKVHKLTGWSRSLVSHYRHDKSHFDGVNAKLVAQLLEINIGTVATSAEFHRAKDKDMKSTWKRLCELSTAAAIVITAKIDALVTSPELDAMSATATDFFTAVHCILCQIADPSKSSQFNDQQLATGSQYPHRNTPRLPQLI